MSKPDSQSLSWFYGVILGWMLGLFSLPITKDSEAREKCLNKLNTIKRILKSLAKHIENGTSEQKYYDHLIQVDTLFEDLNVDRTGLLLCPHDLVLLLAESLRIMRQLDPKHQNPAYHTMQTAVQIEMLWNGNKPISQDFEPLEKIQQSISKHLFGRALNSFCFIFKRLNPKTPSKH